MSVTLKERDGALLWLILNEPARRNPLTADAVTELRKGLEEAAKDPEIRAVLIRAEGKHFSAGVDLAALQKLAELSYEENLADSKHLESLFREILLHPKIIVAVVHGAAMGGGCGLAAACDFVVAADDAKFQYSEVKIGFVPALVSTFLLRRVDGRTARRLLLDPAMVDAEEALRIGLADRQVPRDRLEEEAAAWARAICDKAAASSIARTKELLFEAPTLRLDQALAKASEVNAKQRATEDCRRGVRTFLEQKTTPSWLSPE